MNGSTINHKLKVFISSRCDKDGMKYKPIRKALKHLLEETGMIETYCFETEPASSVSLPEDYLEELNDSQLLILMVDNEDGYTDSVLNEYQYAKAHNLRILALFCDEKNKNKTPIEMEILNTGEGHVETVHDFSDFSFSAYVAVMQDLLKIYKKKPLSYIDNKQEFNNIGKNNLTTLLVDFQSDLILDKKLLKEFEVTKKALNYYVFKDSQLEKSENELDNDFAIFLATLLCEQSFNEKSFDIMSERILAKHKENTRNVIRKRLECLKLYYNGDVDSLEQKLGELLNEVEDDKKLAEWIKNDIAIDVRNININKNWLNYFNVGQQALDKSKQLLCYPAIDRFCSEIKTRIIAIYQTYFNDSPYTTTISSVELILNDIASYYCIALYYGSITHLNMTRQLLIELLCALRLNNKSIKIFNQLIKFTLLQHNSKLLSSIMRSDVGMMLNYLDTEYLINSINNIPIKKDQNITKMVLLKKLGYYITDGQFEQLSDWLFNFTYKYFSGDRNYLEYREILLDSYKYCCNRLQNKKLFDLIKKLFIINANDSVDFACNIISCLHIKTMSDQEQCTLKKYLEILTRNKERRNNIRDFQMILLFFCKNATIDINSLRNIINKNMPNFYTNNFILEIDKGDRESNLKFINKFLEEIKIRVEAQTKNKYTNFGNSPCITIVNILKYKEIALNKKEIEDIVGVAKIIIMSNTQTCRDKSEAMELLIYLANKFPEEYMWIELANEFNEKIESVIDVSDFDLFDKTTINTLIFYLKFLRLITKSIQKEEEITLWSNIFAMQDIDIINCLKLVSQTIEERKNCIYNSEDSIIQLCIAMIGNKERDICYFATKCLASLFKSKYKDTILQQFSKIIDYGNVNSKIEVIRCLKNIDEKSDEINYILQKAQIDKNYFVRNELKDMEYK